jgi:uncharacterized protein with NAD-binding domain and iron-sulfur cluster
VASAREKVAVIGGGVAGLSAAHELVQKGFDVVVYERREFFGGKAASYRVAPTPKPDGVQGRRTMLVSNDDPNGLPGEHGFRFVPGWYRHLTDTLTRIPYHEPGGGVGTVAENLVSIRSNLLAWFDRAPLQLPLQIPGNLAEASATSRFIAEFSRLGLTASETALFMRKLVELLLMPEERRVEVLESKSWWDYLECSNPERSRAYLDFVRASTRTSVAAKAEQVSAYTIGRLVVRTLLDTIGAVDRVFNGPTSEVWIDPWVSFLKSRGVRFMPNRELASISLDKATSKVVRVTMEPVNVSCARRLKNRLDELADLAPRGSDSEPEKTQRAERRKGVEIEAVEVARQFLRLLPETLEEVSRHDEPEDELELQVLLAAYLRDGSLGPIEVPKLQVALKKYWAELSQGEGLIETVVADYFVLALPLEQLAYYVNRSTMLAHLAPELRRVIPLSREMDWMAGIQFYMGTPLDVAPGHLVGLDSDWALTAIEQTRFWDDVPIPREVRGILSVDIGAWDKKGRRVRKEAFNCTDEEIAEEVWAELREMLNRPDRSEVLRDDMLLGGKLARNYSYHLDDSVIDLRDRKKQATYERARGLVFGTLEDQAEDGTGKIAENYVWGPPRRRYNAEPLLINRPGSRRLRPEARTAIPNLFLAGDYIKTETDLACMEGANEAARIAVNGILEVSGSKEERCKLWPFSPSRQALEVVTSASAPLQAMRGITSVVTSLRDRVWKGFASF